LNVIALEFPLDLVLHLFYPAENPMKQKHEPEPRDAAHHHCVWCEREYVPTQSRARSAALFCSTKCEIEARWWLVEKLEAPDLRR
jgi:hypothetical protein